MVKRDWVFFVTVLLLLSGIVGCQTASTQVPQELPLTITFIPTVMPTSTETPEPSPSPVPTTSPTSTLIPSPTPEDPMVIAEQLGFLSKGKAIIETVDGHRYLTSYHAQIHYAVYENDVWRKLDPSIAEDFEAMYGYIVPARNYFFDYNVTIPALSIPSLHRVLVIYLGEYEMSKITYNGQEVRLPLLLTGLRSADGKLHLVKVAVETPDLEPKRWYGTNWIYGSNSGRIVSRESKDLFPVLNKLNPGEMLLLDVAFSRGNAKLPGLAKQEYLEDFKGPNGSTKKLWSNAGSRMLRYLYNHDTNRITYAEAQAMEDGAWPDRVITVYNEAGLLLYMPEPESH